MAGSSFLDDPLVAALLDDAPLLFLAVAGRSGPHVTPIAFDSTDRDLWVVAPRRSAKVRAVLRDPRVGALVRTGDRALVLGGRAHVLDPLSGRGLGSLTRPDRLPRAALGYLTRNDRRVVDAVREHPFPTLPLSRVALRIRLSRVALLDGDALVGSWGDWPEPSVLLSGTLDPAPPALDDVPPALRPLLTEPQDAAALGWPGPQGPLALPGRWDPAGLVRIPTAAMELAGALVAGPACVTVERSGSRLSSVRGLMLAGPGRARDNGTTAQICIQPERTVWWSGEDSATIRTPVAPNA